jgi:hypothetical protein
MSRLQCGCVHRPNRSSILARGKLPKDDSLSPMAGVWKRLNSPSSALFNRFTLGRPLALSIYLNISELRDKNEH